MFCRDCAAPRRDTDHFCEVCGADFRPAPRWLSSSAVAGPCARCGAAEPGPEGYCERCGHRREAGSDRSELELAGVAAVTDRGHRRRRNEDAVAIGRTDQLTVAVVCDGVSTSSYSDDAANAAVGAAVETLLRELTGGAPPDTATTTACAAAAAAVARLSGPATSHNPPSCTYVSAVVDGDTVTVGWIGDSRAYWLGPSGARRLTVDDSLAGAAEADGGTVDPELAPHASALTRWVGADADSVDPRLVRLAGPGPGSLVLCSDGLSRYLADPADLEVRAGESPAEAARRFTAFALDAGGADNIAVAVLPFHPKGGPDE